MSSFLDQIKRQLSQTAATGSTTASKVLGKFNAPRIGPDGSSLFASLANWGGNNPLTNNKGYQPFKWVKPAQATGNITPTNNTPFYPTPDGKLPSGNVLGIGDNDGSGTIRKTTGDPTGDPTGEVFGEREGWMSAEEKAYNAKKTAIMAKLDMMKQEAGRLRGSAGDLFTQTKDSIGKNYGALRDLSKSKLDDIISRLGQADTNTQNMYGIAAGNARQSMEGALTRHNIMSKVLGNAGGSFYTNTKNDISSEGRGNVNDLYAEEVNKRADIESTRGNTTAEFGAKDVAIQEEETGLLNQAQRDYNDAIAQADMMEKNYNIDSTEAIDAADAALETARLNIDNYIKTKYADAGNTATTNTANTSKWVNDYNTNALDTNLKNQDAIDNSKTTNERFIAGGSSYGGNTANDASGGSWLDLLKKKNTKRPEDVSGYYQNYA